MLHAIFLALTQAAEQAVAFDYSYVDLIYARIDADAYDDDVDGFGIGGSLAVDENVHVFAGFSRTEGEILGFDIEVDTLSGGIGFHSPISERADVVVDVGLATAEASSDDISGEVEDDAIFAGARLRLWAAERVEASVGATWYDWDEGDSVTVFGGGLLFHATEQVAFGISAATSDDADQIVAGVRFSL